MESQKSKPHSAKSLVLPAAEGEFRGHSDVAVDSTDRIIVADSSNHRVQVFDPAGGFLFKFGRGGPWDGEFWHARAVAVDSADRIVVADSRPPVGRVEIVSDLDDGHNRIQVFDAKGHFLFEFGGAGSGEGHFRSPPRGITVDGFGRIIVATPFPDHHLHVFDSTGNFLFKFGGHGRVAGKFSGGPGEVAVDSENRIFAANPRGRIEVFDSTGKFLFQIGNPPAAGPGTLGRRQADESRSGLGPLDVAVDSEGRLIVADGARDRVVVYGRREGSRAGPP